ncbi:MAG: toxin [Treponema sp. GWB1_62_6]|nr:MAG: toxin [Treponema sp. GWC1_61_84]OHE69973.1 MAG: toxin [Treponema sp. GWB1_62_6]OHE77123.1 MAG: toxin [Treponema sp. RIFOXYC1_FULL_61_9]HCM25797.1 toxin [Treponema sp.]
MKVEFDPSKNVSNKLKHGIDFIEAQGLWDDPRRVEFETQFVNEKRYGIIAEYSGKLWCAIYTWRNKVVRIISVRRARDYEEDIYSGNDDR